MNDQELCNKVAKVNDYFFNYFSTDNEYMLKEENIKNNVGITLNDLIISIFAHENCIFCSAHHTRFKQLIFPFIYDFHSSDRDQLNQTSFINTIKKFSCLELNTIINFRIYQILMHQFANYDFNFSNQLLKSTIGILSNRQISKIIAK